MEMYCPVCPPGTVLERNGDEYWCPWEERPVTAEPFPGSMTAAQRDAIRAGFAAAGVTGDAEKLELARRWLTLPGLPGLVNLSWPEAAAVLEQLHRGVNGPVSS
jgi:hypothetical protein